MGPLSDKIARVTSKLEVTLLYGGTKGEVEGGSSRRRNFHLILLRLRQQASHPPYVKLPHEGKLCARTLPSSSV